MNWEEYSADLVSWLKEITISDISIATVERQIRKDIQGEYKLLIKVDEDGEINIKFHFDDPMDATAFTLKHTWMSQKKNG